MSEQAALAPSGHAPDHRGQLSPVNFSSKICSPPGATGSVLIRGFLELEITESAAMHDVDLSVKIMKT